MRKKTDYFFFLFLKRIKGKAANTSKGKDKDITMQNQGKAAMDWSLGVFCIPFPSALSESFCIRTPDTAFFHQQTSNKHTLFFMRMQNANEPRRRIEREGDRKRTLHETHLRCITKLPHENKEEARTQRVDAPQQVGTKRNQGGQQSQSESER